MVIKTFFSYKRLLWYVCPIIILLSPFRTTFLGGHPVWGHVCSAIVPTRTRFRHVDWWVFTSKSQMCRDKSFPTWSWWSNHCHGFKFQNWWYAPPHFRQTHRGWPLVLWPVCRKFSMSAGRPRETTTARWDRRIKGRATAGIRNRQQTKNPTCPKFEISTFRFFKHTHAGVHEGPNKDINMVPGWCTL